MAEINQNNKNTKSAIFASGCFWGTQHCFQSLGGVKETTVGYSGGRLEEPSYEEVSSGETGHVESILVEYEPDIISYKDLLKKFFETHNFGQSGGQGPDIGSQYESKIFYDNEKEKKDAQAVINELEDRGYKVATKLQKRSLFWPAEEYHQDYYKKSGQKPYCYKYKKIFE